MVALLSSKLPLDALDRKGRTACYLAAAHAHPSALRALLACGADCTLRARDGSASLDDTSDEECRLLLGGAAREQTLTLTITITRARARTRTLTLALTLALSLSLSLTLTLILTLA